VNTSLKELIVNIDSIKRDLPPLRYSLKDPFAQFKTAYQEYHQKRYNKNWNGDIFDRRYLEDLIKSIRDIFKY